MRYVGIAIAAIRKKMTRLVRFRSSFFPTSATRNNAKAIYRIDMIAQGFTGRAK